MNYRALHGSGRLLAVLVGALIANAPGAQANDALFEEADEAAREQRLADMQSIYERILDQDPDNVRALTGKAAAHAWQQDYAAAQSEYSRAISIEPDNIDAHVGLGYAYAWAAQYTAAHTSFQRALRIDPMHPGARKGVAYTYFWSGEHEFALEYFDVARSVSSNDAEIEEATGHVKLSLGKERDAIRHFDNALRLDPGRSSARQARKSAFLAAPELELSSRIGTTSGAGTGLRSFELAHWPSQETRIGARYDNSLGMDNPSIADRDEDAPGYFLSVHQRFSNSWAADAEIGRRDLVTGDQEILMLQAIHNSSLGVIRLGGQVGRHDAGHTDRLIFGGINRAIGDRWRVEPIVYLSRSGATKDDEWRAVVNVEYQLPGNWSAGAFAGTGQISSFSPAFDGSTTVAGVWANLLVADRHTVQLAVRREESPSNDFTVAELGFTYRIPGN